MVITLHGKQGQACWKVTALAGVPDPTYAYVWRGAAGKRGTVVFPLSTSKKLTLTGCAPAPIKDITAIEHDPSDFYVTIASMIYPTEAVRGQL